MLTVRDFDTMTNDDRWLGWGYLGERQRTSADPAAVAAADRRAVEAATAAGWDYEQLFAWANSKTGRWYADCMFGAKGTDAERYLPSRVTVGS